MQTSERGMKIIKDAESCCLTAYPDPASVLGKACTSMRLPMTDYMKVPRWQLLKADPVTIGWGHTGPSVKLGDKIDQKTADSLLRMDMKFAETALWGLKLNQNQFDALVSLIFNIGATAFSKSTLLRCLRAGDFEAAAAEFPKWRRAGGQVLKGLVKRREAEQSLFREPVSVGGAA